MALGCAVDSALSAYEFNASHMESREDNNRAEINKYAGGALEDLRNIFDDLIASLGKSEHLNGLEKVSIAEAMIDHIQHSTLDKREPTSPLHLVAAEVESLSDDYCFVEEFIEMFHIPNSWSNPVLNGINAASQGRY